MKYRVGGFAFAPQFVPALVIALAAFGANGSPGAPEGLLVNGVSNPLAIERDAVRFTWRSSDTGRRARYL
jgi:hypothetical protein